MFLTMFLGCKVNSDLHFTKGIPQNGVLDLRGVNLILLEPFSLAGKWDAFPGKLPKTESEFQALANETPVALSIPGYWINQNLPAHGVVTYRLKILVDDPGNLMIYLREASSAYKIFSWDNERGLMELGGGGKLSENSESGIGYYTETARAFRVKNESVIYFQVSNYLYSRGGPYYSPLLGGASKTLLHLRYKERKKFFFVGVFFLLTLYHIILYLHRRAEKYTIFYALLCFGWFLRILLFERITRDWFEPSDVMEMTQIRLEYLAFIAVQYFSIQFFFHFFRSIFSQKMQRILLIPVFILGLITLVTPYSFYTRFLQFTQIYMILILVFSTYSVIRYLSKAETRYVGLIFLIGSVIILFTTIYDSLVFLYRWDLPFLTDFGFSFYSICLAIVISSRNSHAWETSEYLTLNLQKEIDWKTIELRREKEKAEKASELKDKFISIVSHDIRSPLFGISSVVNLLAEVPPTLPPEKAKQVLGDASAGLKNLLSMVEDLIQYSRFQNATVFPDYQLFDYFTLLDTLKDRAKKMAEAKNLTIMYEIDEASIGIGDPNLIEHLIWNLITNAIKFTPDSGKISILLREENQHWCLSIEDTGIGFPEYMKDTIFEEGFHFLRKGTNDEMGAGVGLAFCKEVSDRHGAKLEATSLEGNGAIFKFILPNYEKVVLVLDDNPGYRNQLRKLLRKLPCISWEEEFPDHAIKSIAKLKPDLIIVDFAMPEKNGIEFLRELYSDPDMLEIKSLLLSSSMNDPNTGKKLESDLLLAGGDTFLRKTVTDEKLLSEIKRLLSLN